MGLALLWPTIKMKTQFHSFGTPCSIGHTDVSTLMIYILRELGPGTIFFKQDGPWFVAAGIRVCFKGLWAYY